MEKSQLDLCHKVLKKLFHAGILDGVVIIGSWALYFYRFYFKDNEYIPDIRTRDIEFLIPETGKGYEKPYPLPNLGLNAQPLRFLSFLSEHLVTIEFEGMKLKLPNPIAYALHKLIVFGRRKSKDKADKDRIQAINLLNFIVQNGENREKIKTIFDTMHKKWQKIVLNNLEKLGEKELIFILT